MIISWNDILPTFGGLLIEFDDLNPLNLPPYTIRLRYAVGEVPPFRFGTGVQVSVDPNIWDLTYENPDWGSLLMHGNGYAGYVESVLLEVLGANSIGVTNMGHMLGENPSLYNVALFDTTNTTSMDRMFQNCSSLTTSPKFPTSNVILMGQMFSNCKNLVSVPKYDTSNVQTMAQMFEYCVALTEVPLLDTSNVVNMQYMLLGCTALREIPLFNTAKSKNMYGMCWNCNNVRHGALALYNQASTQTNPPDTHSYCFRNCGTNTTTGSAELAQIPSDWK